MQKAFKISLLAGLVVSGIAQASDEFRQHEAHVHGHVEFNIAQDADELLVEITAPGADVVGFEHAPENHAQEEKIEAAEKTLKQAEEIILLSAAAGCSLEHVSVKNTLEKDEHHDHEGHDHEKHDDHDHEKHEDHDHEKHDDHDHDKHEGHDHEEHEHSGHGEFTIEYHFECSDISKLSQVGTNWFKHFPATEEVEVNLLTDTAQVAAELNKDKTVIKL
ncbi:DUF2796 domain-containing protein [Vibrio sp. JC009]|uniref:zinc uptake protein ZrgA n=1 Tax=Vibrio sp. JC009 TaxID=2912314 RepID=UPI0023AEFBE1|nr:DUF2796 domain-containing protein [Vibrio sp. JC009]WED22123.1 DUF2796 domain-containing protein [Vibrio sp. JC009]